MRRFPAALALGLLACTPKPEEGAAPHKAADAGKPADKTPVAPAPAAAAKPGKTPKAIADEVLAAMDPAAKPCEDFYRYACGGWLDATKLPDDKSRWTRSFSVLTEHNREVMREILEQAGKDAKNEEHGKLGRFYAACMDEKAVDAAGHTPLKTMFDEIAAVTHLESFMALAGKLHRHGARPLFSLYVSPDDKDPGRNIAHFDQGGLGLPDRDYYLAKDKKELRTAYQEHLARMLALLGEEIGSATKTAAAIVALETKLAKLQMDRVTRRDPDKTYNKIDVSGLREKVPALAWDAYLNGAGHPEIVDINVDSVEYLAGAAKLLAKQPPKALQDYLRWTLLRSAAEHLSAPFVEESFAFYGKKLRGQKENEARWKRCVSATDSALGHALGRLYVDREFPGDSRAVALDLIQRIEAAFEGNLPALTWMDDATRARAVEKMKAIRNKIGYPDKWQTYEGLNVTPGDHFANVAAGAAFEFDYRAAQIGKPVDKEEWRRPPPVVNASYSGTRNEMWFPAGILQAPFFHRDHPLAMNFGAIGMVMGHELTHGFDDQGRKFDATGKLTPWWEPKVVAEFEKRAACVADLYGAQEVEPGLEVNGKLTLGENIADLGGLKQALLAYRKWAAEHDGDKDPHVPGLTNEQLLFVAHAQVWCTVQTPEAARVQVATDPHSPARFRVNVPAMSTPQFAEVFACEPGTPMNPVDRCEVW